jgi:hypothetical protein
MGNQMHKYEVGDPTWIHIGGHDNLPVKGEVIMVLDVPGYSEPQYLIALSTGSMDDLLEVRDAFTMRPHDPRAVEIRDLLVREFGGERDKCFAAALKVLEIIGD